MVNVPKMPELSVANLMVTVAKDRLLQSYLPDLIDEQGKTRAINRRYLFNIINTVKPTFFPNNIRELMRSRRDQEAERN